MTRRAQAYLAICAARHVAIGSTCVLIPGSYRSTAYDGIKQILPIRAWGVIFLVAAAWATAAAVTRRESPARIALQVSATASGCWTAGFIAASIVGLTSVPSSPVMWATVTLYDLTMLRQPLRNPFENVVRKLAGDDRRSR